MDKVIYNKAEVCREAMGCGGLEPHGTDRIQISEEYYKKMCGEIGITISSKDIALLIERGYIKEELKPCPFCGSVSRNVDENGFIQCGNHDCSFTYYINPALWNKRA